MFGSILPRSEFRLDDQWTSVLNAAGVEKAVVYRSIFGASVNGFMTQLMTEAPNDFPAPGVAHMTYLGFYQQPLGLLFRAVDSKDFRIWMKYPDSRLAFYVTMAFEQNLDQFRFGMPVVLVEGVKDAEAFCRLTGYPYVIAYLTSGVVKQVAAFLSALTNAFMYVPDNDWAGNRSIKNSQANLQAFGNIVFVCHTRAKDFGDLFFASEEDRKNDVSSAKTLLGCFPSPMSCA